MNDKLELFSRVINLWNETIEKEEYEYNILDSLRNEFPNFKFTLAGDKIIFEEI